MMGTMALWERVKTAVRGDENVRWNFWTILLSPLIAESLKSPRQRVRSSSGEKRRRKNESQSMYEYGSQRNFHVERRIGKSAGCGAAPPAAHGDAARPGPEAGMIGERIELLGFEGMHGGKVVTGVPFSAVAVSESAQTLADGKPYRAKDEHESLPRQPGTFPQGSDVLCGRAAGDLGTAEVVCVHQ